MVLNQMKMWFGVIGVFVVFSIMLWLLI